jgi:hypothetical protein
LVQRKDPIEFDDKGIPQRTWTLEGISRDWKIEITLEAGESELKKLKESD